MAEPLTPREALAEALAYLTPGDRGGMTAAHAARLARWRAALDSPVVVEWATVYEDGERLAMVDNSGGEEVVRGLASRRPGRTVQRREVGPWRDAP